MGKSRIHPVIHVSNGLVVTRHDVWGWFKVPETDFFMRSVAENESSVIALRQLLSSLVADNPQDGLDIHLRSVRRRFNTAAWAASLTERSLHNNPPPALGSLVSRGVERLEEMDTLVPENYLGVRLGSRGQSATTTWKAAWKTITRTATAPVMGRDTEVVSEEEMQRWQRQLLNVFAQLRHTEDQTFIASAADLIWLIRKPFYDVHNCPDTDIPQLEKFNADDIVMLTTGVLDVQPTVIEVSNLDANTGSAAPFYTATACISKFSDTLHWPETTGWADLVRARYPDGEWSIRATILPPALVKKEIKDGMGSIQEEINDAAQSGHDGGRKLQEQAAIMAELEYAMAGSTDAWALINYRVQLRGGSPEEVDNIYGDLRTNLQTANLTLTRPPHDQLDLLLESVPGGPWKPKNAYTRRQSLSVLGGGGLLSSYQVGDRDVLGPYLGRVAAGNQPPVFFDPNRAIALNQGPVNAVSGSPGHGKTFHSLNLAYQSAARGYKTIYIDPKADAVGFANLPDLGRVTLFDLKDGGDGLLDPFRLGVDREDAGVLALEVVKTLLSDWTEARESAVMGVIEDVKNETNPSLWSLSERCLAYPKGEAAYNIGLQLKQLRSAPFGRLLFSEKPVTDRLSATDGLTVVTLLGLETPGAGTPVNEYTYGQRIGVAVMLLLAKYAQGLMLAGDKNAPKALFIDEAWAILGTAAGRTLVNSIARMGRSHNTSLTLISQNVRDFIDAGIANQVSTRFAFGSDDPSEHTHILDFLGVDVNPTNLSILHALATQRFVGHCLMKDSLGRVGLVHVDPYRQDLFAAFDTNPETRAARARAAVREQSEVSP